MPDERLRRFLQIFIRRQSDSETALVAEQWSHHFTVHNLRCGHRYKVEEIMLEGGGDMHPNERGHL